MAQNKTESKSVKIFSLVGRDVRQVYPTTGEPLPTQDAVNAIGRVSLEAIPIRFTTDGSHHFEICFRDFGDGNEDGLFLSCIDLSDVPEKNRYKTIAKHVKENYGQVTLLIDM